MPSNDRALIEAQEIDIHTAQDTRLSDPILPTPESDSIKIESDSNEIESDSNEIKSDSNEIESDSNEIESDSS